MDEFDIELDSDIGTSVSKIKNKEQNIITNNPNNDTEIDYDKQMHIAREDPLISSSNLPDKFTSYIQDVRPKREINMNKIVRNIENNIDNYSRVNINEPLPVNFSKNMFNSNQSQIIESFSQIPSVETIKVNTQQVEKKGKKFGFKYLDIFLYVLIFMLLNNKFIIELIYDRVPYIKSMDSPYPNLILRSIVFGILIFLIKKFNL
jgi:subtilase family serine protease